MNKHVALTITVCLWVVLFGALGIYTFSTPRVWVLSVLATKSGIDLSSIVARPFELSETAAVSNALIATTSATSTSSLPPQINPTISIPINASGPTQVTYIPPTTYEYKLMQDVDPCTLTKMGADGWHALQFGGNIVSTGGGNAACATRGTYDGFDWILFERVRNSVQQ